MNTHLPPDFEKRARWQTLWHKLAAVRFEPLPSEAEIDAFMQALPPHRTGESLTAWLGRANQRQASRRLIPLAEFVRWAASGAAETWPSLPQAPMVSLDESFRLTVTQEPQGLHLRVEALGFAAYDHAGCEAALALGDGDELVAEFQLDDDGKGDAYVEDSQLVRQALVRPLLVKIEYDDDAE